MLYLSRKVGQSIVINDKIVVTVAEVRGNNIKLSFDSPPDVRILRQEIYEKINAENRAAAQGFDLIQEAINGS